MFKFFGRLFGSDKALESVVESAAKGIDKLIYTSEEKSEAAAADRSEARRMVVAWMSATQGQNLARRLIALSITGVWLLQFVIAQIMNLVQVWSLNTQWTASAAVMQAGAEAMNGAVMLILAFYFAAPHMSEIASAVTGKFVKDSERKG